MLSGLRTLPLTAGAGGRSGRVFVPEPSGRTLVSIEWHGGPLPQAFSEPRARHAVP